jgi:hypothetical protein
MASGRVPNTQRVLIVIPAPKNEVTLYNFNSKGIGACSLKDGLKKSFLEKYSPATMRVTGRRFR